MRFVCEFSWGLLQTYGTQAAKISNFSLDKFFDGGTQYRCFTSVVRMAVPRCVDFIFLCGNLRTTPAV